MSYTPSAGGRLSGFLSPSSKTFTESVLRATSSLALIISMSGDCTFSGVQPDAKESKIVTNIAKHKHYNNKQLQAKAMTGKKAECGRK